MYQLLQFDSGLELSNIDLLEALTLKNTNDAFNMERSEVLGKHNSEYYANSVRALGWKTKNSLFLTLPPFPLLSLGQRFRDFEWFYAYSKLFYVVISD